MHSSVIECLMLIIYTIKYISVVNHVRLRLHINISFHIYSQIQYYVIIYIQMILKFLLMALAGCINLSLLHSRILVWLYSSLPIVHISLVILDISLQDVVVQAPSLLFDAPDGVQDHVKSVFDFHTNYH